MGSGGGSADAGAVGVVPGGMGGVGEPVGLVAVPASVSGSSAEAAVSGVATGAGAAGVAAGAGGTVAGAGVAAGAGGTVAGAGVAAGPQSAGSGTPGGRIRRLGGRVPGLSPGSRAPGQSLATRDASTNSLRNGWPSNPSGNSSGTKFGWPSKAMPNISYVSRSCHPAPANTPVTEARCGSASGTTVRNSSPAAARPTTRGTPPRNPRCPRRQRSASRRIRTRDHLALPRARGPTATAERRL